MWHDLSMLLWPLINRLRVLLIPAIESYLRSVDAARLLGYALAGKKTVKEVINADAIAKGRKFLVFATYPAEKLFESHIRLLKKLQDRGYTIIVASNSARAKMALRPLLDQPWVFVFRQPFGRDFGCYKDCALMLYRHADNGGNVERVIFMNDSVITFEPGEDRIIDYLDNPAFCAGGITENYEFGYHVGSFMIAISGTAFMTKRVRKFWKNYWPISTRRYAIHKGEMGLTRVLMRSGYVPRVLYRVYDFKRYLESLDLDLLEEVYHFLEPTFLKKYGPFMSRLDQAIDTFIREDKDTARGSNVRQASAIAWPNLQKKEIPGLFEVARSHSLAVLFNTNQLVSEYDEIKLALLRYRDRLLSWEEQAQKGVLIKRTKQEIIDSMLAFAFTGSQIHRAATVLLYMNAGILKKDIVYRGHIEPHNLGLILVRSGACTSPEQISAVTHEVLAKGHPYSFERNLGKHALYQWGFI